MTGNDAPRPNLQSGSAIAPPSPWVNYYLRGIRARGHLLDLAAGRGRHARLALAAKFEVTAVDRDVSGLNDLKANPNINIIEADLETGQTPPFLDHAFQGVIVTNYLWRPVFDDIMSVLSDDGVLIYETFGHGHARYGKPSNPDFLLKAGELCDIISGKLQIVAYEHITMRNPEKIVSRVCAVGPKHPWLETPPGRFIE